MALSNGCQFCNIECGNQHCAFSNSEPKEEDNMIKVDYIQHWGDDLMVANAARVSFGNEKDALDEKDVKLINYLASHKHMTPFEHMGMTVKIECPLYIRSQIMRHRTFSYNEISRRYTDRDLRFYIPGFKDFRQQSVSNRQASEGNLKLTDATVAEDAMMNIHTRCFQTYKELIALGLCREQARGVLPQNLMTEFYMTGNLRNWAHFLELRESKDAQAEVRYVSEGVRKLIDKHFTEAAKALNNNNG